MNNNLLFGIYGIRAEISREVRFYFRWTGKSICFIAQLMHQERSYVAVCIISDSTDWVCPPWFGNAAVWEGLPPE